MTMLEKQLTLGMRIIGIDHNGSFELLQMWAPRGVYPGSVSLLCSVHVPKRAGAGDL